MGLASQQLREYYRDLLDGGGGAPSGTPPALAADLTAVNSEHFTIPANADNRGAVGGWWRGIYARLDATSTLQRLAFARPATVGWGFYIDGTDLVIVEAYSDGGSLQTATSSAISGSTWISIYVEYTGTRLRIFLGGSLEDTSGSDFTYAPPGVTTLFVGELGGGVHKFDGRLQVFCGGDGNLTAAQITELAGFTKFADASAGLLAASKWWNDMGEFSDGTGAVTRVDSTANSNDLTDVNTTSSIARDA